MMVNHEMMQRLVTLIRVMHGVQTATWLECY
jgi:hypothetical protein